MTLASNGKNFRNYNKSLAKDESPKTLPLRFFLSSFLSHSLIQLHFRRSNGQTPYSCRVFSVSQIAYSKTYIFFFLKYSELFYKFTHTCNKNLFVHRWPDCVTVTLNSFQKISGSICYVYTINSYIEFSCSNI